MKEVLDELRAEGLYYDGPAPVAKGEKLDKKKKAADSDSEDDKKSKKKDTKKDKKKDKKRAREADSDDESEEIQEVKPKKKKSKKEWVSPCLTIDFAAAIIKLYCLFKNIKFKSC